MMNTKIGIAILAVACLGLAVALVALKKQADDQQKTSATTIGNFSNQIVSANGQIDELSQANLTLKSDLAASRDTALAVSNRLSEQLTETAGTLATTTATLQSSQQQITQLNERISGLNESNADLEAQNQALDQRANSLSKTIADMDAQIALTRAKLASSETNNTFSTPN